MTYILKFKKVPILTQLHTEEELLFNHTERFCLVNEGVDAPSIVLGLSNKPSEHLHFNSLGKTPVIRRFTGGGSVIADHNTLFVTLIDNSSQRLYPEEILRYGLSIYKQVIPGLKLEHNDYVINDQKVGGNALYIRNNRWLLHTSFLWDFSSKWMNLLKSPPTAPEYRKGRAHQDFLTTLKKQNICKKRMIDKLESVLEIQSYMDLQLKEPTYYRSHYV